MKMKYIYRRWLFLMAGALLVANFASCNDNDEPVGGINLS